DRKSTRLNSSHVSISYAVFCLKKKKPMLHRVVPRPLDVEGATARITALLAEREQVAWSDIVGPAAMIVDVMSAFIALLYLAKRSALTLSQPEPFAPMVITRATPRDAA